MNHMRSFRADYAAYKAEMSGSLQESWLVGTTATKKASDKSPDQTTRIPFASEYAVQIKDGHPRITYSLEQAQTTAQKEANRIHKSVWIECSTGDGYYPLEVINPSRRENEPPLPLRHRLQRKR